MINKDIHFKNFGKVKDARIRMRPFTMITGPNSSGKSFITRALYSIFHTLNQDLTANILVKNIDSIIQSINHIGSNLIRITQQNENLLIDLGDDFFSLKKFIVERFESANIFQEQEILNDLKPKIKELIQKVQTIKDSLKVGKGKKFDSVKDYFEELEYSLSQLNSSTDSWQKFYIDELDKELKNSFLGNFQINSLSKLKFRSEKSSISINKSIISINSDDSLGWELESSTISDMQSLHNVVYLESPVYFKLRSSLHDIRFQNLGMSRKNILNQVPKYFYDIEKLLSNEYILVDNNRLKDIINKIEKGIDGQLSMNTRGNIIFNDNEYPDVEIPFNLVSSGISNLGMIALLLKKNILTKGSFLFIDEPELNLHTEWQHLMLEILVDLSLAGVTVMVASHSIDMVLRLQYIVDNFENQEEIENFFSLNRLDKNGTTFESNGILEDIRDAKADLGKPYINLLRQRLPNE